MVEERTGSVVGRGRAVAGSERVSASPRTFVRHLDHRTAFKISVTSVRDRKASLKVSSPACSAMYSMIWPASTYRVWA